MKISIITVCYNSEKYIRSAIESVLRQTYENIEYVVVDGSSKDSTLDIIRGYEPKFNGRMRWISEPDKGIYDAMNKGIAMATGDIVGMLNSDDFYHRNDVIERIAKVFIENKDIQVVFGNVLYVNPNNLNKIVRHYSSNNFSVNKFRYGFMPAHPTFFTYKYLYENLGFYKTNYRITADFELLLRFLYIHKLKHKYIPLDLLIMRTGGISTASFKSNIILNQEMVRACRENGIYTNIFIVFLKYFVKIFELIKIRNKHFHHES
jgi:glycosyltransferase involved in cell wall biosynthesis